MRVGWGKQSRQQTGDMVSPWDGRQGRSTTSSSDRFARVDFLERSIILWSRKFIHRMEGVF